MGVFWKRTNAQGAFWGLIFGFILGIIRFALEFGYSKPSCGSLIQDTRPAFVKAFVDDIHYLHYGAILFVITGAVTIIISMMTEPIPEEKLYRLTFWNRKSTEVRDGFDDLDDSLDDDTILQPEKVDHITKESQEITGFKKIMYLICGIPQNSNQNATNVGPKKSREEEAAEAAAFLKEKTSLKIIVNVSAVLSMSLACFVVAFYA